VEEETDGTDNEENGVVGEGGGDGHKVKEYDVKVKMLVDELEREKSRRVKLEEFIYKLKSDMNS
jgi:hypothetical protein